MAPTRTKKVRLSINIELEMYKAKFFHYITTHSPLSFYIFSELISDYNNLLICPQLVKIKKGKLKARLLGCLRRIFRRRH